MKKGKSRIVSLLAAAALCASMLVAPASAGSSAVSWNDTIGGKTANLVTVAMGPGRTGEISLANDSVVESTSATALINQKNAQANTHVVAAINGGFFNSYTSGNLSFPSNCPAVMDAVIINNKLVHTGRSAMLGFAADGTPMVDWVDFTGTEVRLGNGYAVNCGRSVNAYESAPEAIMVFNDHMTLPVTIPATSTIVLIKGGVVTGIGQGGYAMTVPEGTDVLVYNSAAAKLYQEWGQFPQVGMTAKVVLKAAGTDRDAAWSNVENALTGGPVLVKNGVNVLSDSRNSSFYGDPKQMPDYVAARSFVAITNDNMLVMGTVTASMNQIANWVVSKGWKEAIAMDGGASTMLYADSSGFITPAGRNLAVALTIVDRTGNGGLPAESNVGNPNTDTPSSWAVAEVNAAISAGLVPDTLQKSYLDEISRQDFCLMIYELIQKHPDWINKIYSSPEVGFSDVSSPVVELVARTGIISGVGGGKFDPYSTLTRAQAAKIMALTAQFFGAVDAGAQYDFTDRADFPIWDDGFIDFCGVNKIMSGKGNGVFDPNGTLTRQEAILCLLRVYNGYCA